MAYGVLSTGFARKPLSVSKQEIEDELKATYGDSINLLPESVFGQLVGIVADRESELWDLAEAVYSSFDPDAATGDQLDNICALTGTTRRPASKSTVAAVCYGTNGTTLLAGRVASVATSGTRFASLAEAEIVTVDAWADTTGYVEGDLVLNDTGKLYYATDPGTSAASGGPTGTGTAIVDGGVVWRYIATVSAAVVVAFEAEDTGALAANAGTLTTIETAVSGWSGVSNPVDADPGDEEETDPALRLRRERELAGPATSPANAIRNDILDVDGVEQCKVFVNNTDSTDADSLPPHSVEVVVLADDTENADVLEDVRAQVFDSVAAGIATYGTNSGTVVDDSGTSQTVKFTEATEVPIYVRVDVVKDASVIPTASEAQFEADIAQAIVDFANGTGGQTGGDADEEGFNIGDDVNASALYVPTFSIPGVRKISLLYIDDAPVPASAADVVIGPRAIATFDTANVDVNVS